MLSELEGSRHLRDRVTLAGQDILSVSSGDTSQNLLKRIEREATHRHSLHFTIFRLINLCSSLVIFYLNMDSRVFLDSSGRYLCQGEKNVQVET